MDVEAEFGEENMYTTLDRRYSANSITGAINTTRTPSTTNITRALSSANITKVPSTATANNSSNQHAPPSLLTSWRNFLGTLSTSKVPSSVPVPLVIPAPAAASVPVTTVRLVDQLSTAHATTTGHSNTTTTSSAAILTPANHTPHEADLDIEMGGSVGGSWKTVSDITLSSIKIGQQQDRSSLTELGSNKTVEGDKWHAANISTRSIKLSK